MGQERLTSEHLKAAKQTPVLPWCGAQEGRRIRSPNPRTAPCYTPFLPVVRNYPTSLLVTASKGNVIYRAVLRSRSQTGHSE